MQRTLPTSIDGFYLMVGSPSISVLGKHNHVSRQEQASSVGGPARRLSDTWHRSGRSGSIRGWPTYRHGKWAATSDVPMQTLTHNWYWGRAKAGPYTVIATNITATEAYGYETQILYMLAKDDEIVADDDVSASRASPSPTSRALPYRDGDARYAVKPSSGKRYRRLLRPSQHPGRATARPCS